MRPCENLCRSDADTQSAALMLLEDFIKKNLREVAIAISRIIPIYESCSYGSLQDHMGTINAAIATIALEVIEDIDMKDAGDPDRRLLPCSALSLKQAIRHLTSLIDSLYLFSSLFANEGVPAINMCRDAFAKDEILG